MTAALFNKGKFFITRLTNGLVASPTTTLPANFARAYSSRDTNFFNREREIMKCGKIFENPPLINVFTGPHNSGKSVLLREVLKRQGDDCPVLAIDMREHAFTDAHSFLDTMEETLAPWYSSMGKVAKGLKVNIGDGAAWFVAAELDLSKIYKPNMSVSRKLESLFSFITANTPQFSFWTGKKFPIFFIDEANKMSNLTRTKEGKDALMQLLEFFVKCTKQDSRFPVLLASSDSFYHLWLEKLIGQGRFTTHVIGHLSKEDAKQYWEQCAVPRYRHYNPSFKAPEFENVFATCGGSIMLLDRYCLEYDEKHGKLPPEKFSFVHLERANLINKGLLESQTRWTKKQFFSVMTKLTKNGFIVYNDLCHEMTKKVVNSMIEANLVHLRPTSSLAFDLEYEVDTPILTPNSPASAAAMKLIVQHEAHLIN